MQKIDFKKKYPEFYKPSSVHCQLVTIPKMNFIMIDGKGDAAKALFQDSIQCLYKLSYSLRKVLKNEKPENYFDYVIPPLEALWWSVSAEFNPRKKSDWRWTLMMIQPP